MKALHSILIGLLKLLVKGSFWGILTSVFGALNSINVLNYVHGKWAIIITVGGTVIAGLSQSLPAFLKDEFHAYLADSQ